MHVCNENKYGDWTINDQPSDTTYLIDLKNIQHLLKEDKIQTLSHNEICWKSMDKPLTSEDFDMKSIKLKYPCIVLTNAKNHKNLKYRMIDGRHRMSKMKTLGINESEFYVLDYEEVKEYIQDRTEVQLNFRDFDLV